MRHNFTIRLYRKLHFLGMLSFPLFWVHVLQPWISYQNKYLSINMYSGDLESVHLKSGHFGGLISIGPVFKWLGISYGCSIVPTIWKLDHSKSGRFCLDFKWFLTKWQPFVRISDVWASGFQIPFKNQTICNPNSFRSF